jgi:hypothetical protein
LAEGRMMLVLTCLPLNRFDPVCVEDCACLH